MSFTWSPKQQAAIDALNTNVLVSASAGAGKTAVLIGRLMKRLETDRISLDEVVAITFTELAASEMRKRLAENLNTRIGKVNDPEIKAHLTQQLSLLPSAYITTIHAFCLKIIENYSYVSGIDPNQVRNVLDEPSKKRLWDEAFTQAYKTMIINNEKSMSELAWHFDLGLSSTKNLKEAVDKLKNKLNTIENQDVWIEMSLALSDVKSYADLKDNHKRYFDMQYKWYIDNFLYRHGALLKAVNGAEYIALLESGRSYKKDLEKRENFIETELKKSVYYNQLKQLSEDFDYDKYHKVLIDMASIYEFDGPPQRGKEVISHQWDTYKKAYERMVFMNFEESDWFSDMRLLESRQKTLIELTKLSMSIYKDLKAKALAIDFDDMEHLAIEILKNDKFRIDQVFKDKIKEIMVDEFQDTNEVQNQIVQLISSGSNVFRVGDVKQSIYRFRNAQPQLMQGLMRINDDNNKVLFLDENYRSKESIVEFNNHIFKQLMDFENLGSYFHASDTVKIGTEQQSGGESIEVHFLNKPEESEESSNDSDDTDVETNTDTQVDPNAKLHVIHMVNTIEKMRAETEYKKYSDYVVLVRSNAEKEYLQDLFEKANIPHHISAKTGFFNAPAVQDVLLMIKAILNPYDDLNFVGLCLSKFIGLSDTDLANMALHRDNRFYVQVFKEDFPEKYQALMDFIYSVRSTDLLTVIKSIFRYNNYYDDYCDKQARVNLDLLFEKALIYRESAMSLSEFVSQITSVKDTESTEAIPFTQEDDVVRVMTIHQSKGLEFRVVLYWSRSSASVKDNDAALIADSELGFMLKTIQFPNLGTRKNPLRIAIEMKTRVEDILEQVRLIYVALTRAVDKLIIIDQTPKFNIPLEDSVMLDGWGSTYLIEAAINASLGHIKVEHISEIIDQSYTFNEKQAKEKKEFKYTVKPSTSLEFKTPSSTHPKMTEVHLNFNQNKGTVHGTEIHKLFEDLPLTDWTKELLLEYKSDLSESDQEAFMTYYQSDIYQAMLKGEIKHEYAFHALMDNHVLHGYMDCIAITETKVFCIDYKTDGLDDPQTFIDLYHEQIDGYMEVLQKQYPHKKVEGYLYSLRLKKFIEIK